MIPFISAAWLAFDAAVVLACAVLALFVVRVVLGERHNGAGGGRVSRTRGLFLLDVAIMVCGVATGAAALARMLIILGRMPV